MSNPLRTPKKSEKSGLKGISNKSSKNSKQFAKNVMARNTYTEYDKIIDGIFTCIPPAPNMGAEASAYDPSIKSSTYYSLKYRYLDKCTLDKAAEYSKEYYETFIGPGGLPTKEYKKLLTRVIQRLVSFNEAQLYQLQLFFFSWDGNHALTGIFQLHDPPNRLDPNYLDTDMSIYRIIESIVNHINGEDVTLFYDPVHHTMDLSNSLITHLIMMMMRKKYEGVLRHNNPNQCSYGNSCYRNPVHRLVAHSPFLQSGSSRKKKRVTRTRKTRKI
jgi:hypothetical protein